MEYENPCFKNGRMEFGKNWRFALTEAPEAVQPDYDDSGWMRVNLPHDWQIEQPRSPDAPGGQAQGYFPREHRGVYRLHFQAEESWKGKNIQILFDGIQRFSTIYLNGQKIGGRPYGYLPVLADLTKTICFTGENLLAVSVDNRMPENKNWYAAGGDRWYSGAGIIRKVWLLLDEPTHLIHDGIRIITRPLLRGPMGDVPDVAGIRCAEARVEITAEVEGPCKNQILRVEILSPKGEMLHAAEKNAETVNRFLFTLEHPLLWTCETPVQYTAVFTLSNGNTRSVRFGIRSADFDPEDGFALNGEKKKLWGVNLHQDGGAFGAAVPEKFWRRRLLALKEMGVNTIRASHNPLAEELYDLCDELGFLVIDELYDKWDRSGMYFDAFFEEWHERDVRDWVRRDANHPCVILWSVGNEVAGQYTEHYFACLKKLCTQVRDLDPSRSLTAALIGFCLPDYNDRTPLGKKLEALRRYAAIVDVFMGNYMEPYYEKMRECGIRIPVIGSEVFAYYRYREGYFNTVQGQPKRFSDIVWKNDWVCGAILWAGIDYLGESTGWPVRGWTGNPLDSTGDWKLRAWHAAAQFKTEPVLKLAVFDESEPWDGARGMWGFPQMRGHWKYSEFEKIMHVGVMTNCEMVRLFQNDQTARTGYLNESEDGMIHFFLPYTPGTLRAEGFRGGMKCCEDLLCSDYEAAVLRIEADGKTIAFDEKGYADLVLENDSLMLIDLFLEDGNGKRFCLEDREVHVSADGEKIALLLDNGNPRTLQPFTHKSMKTFGGHLMIAAMKNDRQTSVKLILDIEGFDRRILRLC